MLNANGFYLLLEAPSLNLHSMVFRLDMLLNAMDYLIKHGPNEGLDHGRVNRILNAKEQLSRMRRLSEALQANDKDGYISAIEELERQAEL